MLDAMLAAFGPFIPWLIAFAVVAVVATAPLPTRSVGERRRDIWRGFRFESRRRVMGRAGGRCESASLVFWLRCPDAAVEADHVYPWSKGGDQQWPGALQRSQPREVEHDAAMVVRAVARTTPSAVLPRW